MELAFDQRDHRLSRRRRVNPRGTDMQHRIAGTRTRITFTGLLASTQGPSGETAISTAPENVFASCVSFTAGLACSPVAFLSTTDVMTSVIAILS